MAKGYPGRTRAQKAFWRGVKSIKRRTPFNPYTHPRLMKLFERGREEVALNPALFDRMPVKFRPRVRQPRRDEYPRRGYARDGRGDSRFDSPRGFSREPGWTPRRPF